jgi:hypothetical protein
MKGDKTYIVIGDEEVVIDPSLLEFTDANLKDYMESEAGWIHYFGSKLCEAEYYMSIKESEYSRLYDDFFLGYKQGKMTEKMAEAKAESEPSVAKARIEYFKAKKDMKHLQLYLRAWEKSHENAQSRTYVLRKEMDRLPATLPSHMSRHEE